MDFELYGDDSKGLIKLDPRTKMVLFFASSIAVINMYNDTAMVIYYVGLCVVLALCGKRATALKAALLFGVLILLRSCMEAQATGTGLIVIIVNALITIGLFAFPVLISLILLIQTTRIGQFLAAFQAMHLPPAAVIPFAVLFRFIPTVQDEWAGIRKAMALRGIEMSFGSVVRHPAKAIEYLLVPLLFSSVSVMEELAAASEARGLDASGVRTSYEEVRLHAIDYAVMAVFAGTALVMLVTTIAGVAR